MRAALQVSSTKAMLMPMEVAAGPEAETATNTESALES